MQPPLTRDRLAVVHALDDQPSVDTALREILSRGTDRGPALGVGYQHLWAGLAAATENGKRLRPALLEAAHHAWGGTDSRAAAVVGAAVELLHTAFVIHDDVIDGDTRRRGRLNVSGSHAEDARSRGAEPARASEYGAAAGILAGDLALSAALRAVATCPAPARTVRRLLDLFDDALHTTAAGELADVRLSLGTDRVSVEDTLTMAEQKTGAYSFALPLQAGAVLADAPESAVAAAGRVGRLLGTAFQLVDDLHGVFGDPVRTGKSVLSDLRSGKQTSLIVHARSTERWPEIAPYVGDPALTEGDGAHVRALLEACGSHTYVRVLATHYAHEALVLGEESGLPPRLLDWLRLTTDELLGRAA
jgi:geranylgeranyl diphosphate synthase type II